MPSSVPWTFNILSIILDIFKSTARQNVEAIEDLELKELTELLPTVVLRGRAPSVVKKYSGAFLRWKAWAAQKFDHQACLPVKPRSL